MSRDLQGCTREAIALAIALAISAHMNAPTAESMRSLRPANGSRCSTRIPVVIPAPAR